MENLDSLKISEEKKKYIVDQLNPVLEDMVAECIQRMPPDPVVLMQEWLEEKKIKDEDALLSLDEKERLEAENKTLAAQIEKVKGQLHEASKMAAVRHDEEEEEEDDELDEPPPGFGGDMPSRGRQSVSAEAYGQWNVKKAFVPPVVLKSDDQKDRLKAVLIRSFMFSALEPNDLNIVVGAMKEVPVSVDESVFDQGDAGDFLFVIESGKFDCVKAAQEATSAGVIAVSLTYALFQLKIIPPEQTGPKKKSQLLEKVTTDLWGKGAWSVMPASVQARLPPPKELGLAGAEAPGTAAPP